MRSVVEITPEEAEKIYYAHNSMKKEAEDA